MIAVSILLRVIFHLHNNIPHRHGPGKTTDNNRMAQDKHSRHEPSKINDPPNDADNGNDTMLNG